MHAERAGRKSRLKVGPGLEQPKTLVTITIENTSVLLEDSRVQGNCKFIHNTHTLLSET